MYRVYTSLVVAPSLPPPQIYHVRKFATAKNPQRHTAKSANINADGATTLGCPNGGVIIRPYKTRFILEILSF